MGNSVKEKQRWHFVPLKWKMDLRGVKGKDGRCLQAQTSMLDLDVVAMLVIK